MLLHALSMSRVHPGRGQGAFRLIAGRGREVPVVERNPRISV
ncbi:hypothetical protein SF83666_c00280 [Sinorhizobium fredii CCBAU 83666]|nr:hypothetical protein SF83666_c00280 [Sinorhizobium fredii CCBAU 83666]